jgi:hypothetical protein
MDKGPTELTHEEHKL